MDALSLLYSEYNETGSTNCIEEMLPHIIALTKKVLKKWYFLPSAVQEDIFEEATSVIFTKCLQTYHINKGSRFSSYYATAVNFYARQENQKYFQYGKQIQKRCGSNNTLSLHFEYDNDENSATLLDILPASTDIFRVINLKLLHSALKKLDKKDRELIESLYFSQDTRKDIIQQSQLSYYELKKKEECALQILRQYL